MRCSSSVRIVHVMLIVLLLSAAPQAAVFAQAAAGSGPVVRVRRCERPPVIDGRVDAGEWRDALVMAGPATSGRGLLEQRDATAYFMCNARNLYFAVQSETQAGNRLHTWPHRPDVAQWREDGIEIWVAPLPSPDAQPVDRFQLWFNPLDARWGMVHRFGVGFNYAGDVEHKSRLENDVWTFELAIPWKEIGVDPKSVREGMHFMIRPTRNWKYPFIYTSWGYPKAFRDAPSMIRVILDDEAPVVKADKLGALAYGDADVQVTINNPDKQQRRFNVLIALFDEEGAKDKLVAKTEEAVTVPGGGAATSRLKQKIDYPDKKRSKYQGATHYLVTRITRVGDGALIYERIINLAQPRENDWQPIPPRKVKLTGGYYPYHQKVKAEIDLGDLKEAEEVTHVTVQVLTADADKLLGTGRITKFTYNTGETILDVPDLPEGNYVMRATVHVGDRALKVDPQPTRRFVRHKLPWEHNKLGITEKVYPPFTPLNVDGRNLSCVLRTHELSGLGLWDQVVSMDAPLLAFPMRLECKVNGKMATWTMPAAPDFVEKAQHRIVHTGKAKSPVLALATRCEWDYDGMMKVTMDIEPLTENKVDELALVIPMKADEATLYHPTTFLRGNPAEAIPAGEGVVWDSRKLVQTTGLGTFAPYVWLGGPERGIAWCAANDKGWITDDKKADFQIVRDGDQVQLRVRFINTPAVVEKTRRIEFGLQATPAKPQPPAHRGWGRYRGTSRPLQFALASWRFAGLSNCESLDPLNGDWTVFDKLTETQRTKKVPEQWVLDWLEKHGQGENKSLRTDCLGVFRKAASGDELVIYTNPPLENGRTPQNLTFNQEWKGGITQSYADYAVWCLDQMLKRGFQGGIYQDNTFPLVRDDTVSGWAYVRQDGRVQPGWDIWGHREMYKRMFVLAWERTGKWPLIAMHVTNSNNICYFSWTTISFDLEWEYYTDRTFQEKFKFSLLQVESTGKQAGMMPIILCRMGGGPRSKADPAFAAFLERTRIGVCLLHDMQPFGSWKHYYPLFSGLSRLGFAKPECEFVPYWRNKPFVSEHSDGIEVSLYRMPQGVLAVACGIADKDGTQRLSLDLEKLGLPADAKLVDFELWWEKNDPKSRKKPGEGAIDTTAGLKILGPGEVEFHLKRHDYRLLLIQKP